MCVISQVCQVVFILFLGFVSLSHTSHTHLKTQIKDGKKKSRAAPIGVSRLFFFFFFPLLE
jgi:hypothetical protein